MNNNNNSFDLPDSTDWLNTPLSLLAPLESSLRCQVCKDFFDNPVITSCSHTFCSLCIRRCLSTEGKCPACRSSDQELRLRRNWAVQELVDAFRNARPSVLEFARKATTTTNDDGDHTLEQPASKKRKVDGGRGSEETGEDAAGSFEGRQTRSRRNRVDSQSQTPVIATETVEDSQDEDFVPDDGLVACPICNRRMKNEAVFLHLDTCTGTSSSPSKQTSFGSLKPMSRSTSKPPERLPAMNYSILKDGVLRRKLRDLGIPDWGPRPLLQRRHTEWMNLWNANCDSKTPKSKKELLRELDIWERTQGGLTAASSSMGSTNSVMRKDFDGAAWSASYDNDFKRLIANARQRSDAIVRTTIPQASVAQDEPEVSSKPEQPAETPIATDNVQKKPELSVDPAGANGAENEVHAYQNTSDTQAVSAPSE